jgi:ribonucleoside-diphosphate reductase alpha chain
MNEAYLQTSSTALQTPTTPKGLTFTRRFSKEGVSPYDELQWERRTASITDTKGNTIFEQKDVEVPVDWSMTATNIMASKYLHGQMGTPERESGVRQLVGRVAETIRDWGLAGSYFASAEDAAIFHDELAHMLLTQKAAFNSPVWFNLGCDRLEPDAAGQNWHWDPVTGGVKYSATGYHNPQCSACFINSVEDSMGGIMDLARTEALLFKFGSGTGTNFSSLRSSKETVSGGGTASGPLSFMRGFDAFAGVIKSGGKTRRAAKMAILNVDHPDIMEFIGCKAREEAKAFTLIKAGYDGSGPDSEAYSSIFFQNANNSVRVSDEFMRAYESDGEFTTYTVNGHQPVKTYKARDIMRKIAEATWLCGDPGMQFDTTINRWHTSKNSGRINASNPCSEYMFLDNSACNLASFNLMKYLTPAGVFDIAAFRHSISVMITAMEILVDNSGYPTEGIARNSHDYRPLGLGYANLGALLMALGLPYDSATGRHPVRPGLSAVGRDCGPLPAAGLGHPADRICRSPGWRLPRLLRQPGAVPGRDPHAPRGGEQHRHVAHERRALQRAAVRRPDRGQPRELGRGADFWRAPRLSQLADHGSGAHGHHRLHDGLRHHRH